MTDTKDTTDDGIYIGSDGLKYRVNPSGTAFANAADDLAENPDFKELMSSKTDRELLEGLSAWAIIVTKRMFPDECLEPLMAMYKMGEKLNEKDDA